MLAALLGIAQCFSQPLDPSVLRLLQPDATLLLGIDWRKAMASSSAGLIHQQLQDEGIASLPGLEDVERTLREDMDSIIVSAPASDGEAPALMILRGQFERVKLAQWLAGRTEKYRNVELVIPGNVKSPTSRLALLDGNTLLFGDRKELVAAIDRFSDPLPQPVTQRLLGRAAALAAKHDLWLVMNTPPGFQSDAVPGQLVSQLSGLDLAASFSEGLVLSANLQAKSRRDARSLATAVQGLLAMAALKNKDAPETADVLRKVQVSETPSTVKLSLSLSEGEIRKTFTTRTAAVTPPQPAKPAPAGPRKIRIIGADSGPMELPLDNTK